MAPRVAGLTGATLETAPSVCHECVWWQSRTRGVDKRRWIAKAEEERGSAIGADRLDVELALVAGRLLGRAVLEPPDQT